jgi:hypothetical protein
LKAKFEGGSSNYSFNRLVPGAFNMSLIVKLASSYHGVGGGGGGLGSLVMGSHVDIESTA